MSSNEKPTTRATLGLTGLTSNAMALIAPGAFLWLTFFIQSAYGAPMAAQGMWFGILGALVLCLATAIAYAELSKLYPGAGSSYFFAEQAFLSKTTAFKFARIAKFIVGWASHLYYWVYPGLMVGVTGLIVGYVMGQLWPDTFNPAVHDPAWPLGVKHRERPRRDELHIRASAVDGIQISARFDERQHLVVAERRRRRAVARATRKQQREPCIELRRSAKVTVNVDDHAKSFCE